MSNKTTSSVPWFLVVNIFTNIIAGCQIILGLIFILIILRYRAYRSVSNYLVANTVFSITLYAISILSISVHMGQCDNYPNLCIADNACLFRNYISDVASTAFIYSLTVQSIHRLLAAIFVDNARLQIYQLRLILCIIQWLVALLFPAYFIYFNPQLQYDSVSYVCIASVKTSAFLTIYTLCIGFLLPVLVTIGAYIKLILFVRRLRTTVFVVNLPLRLSGKHELRMAKRIVLLSAILILGSLPWIMFQCMTSPPDYMMRIYYLHVTIASFCCLIFLFAITTQVRQRLMRWKKKIKTKIGCRKRRKVAAQQNRK